MASNYQLSHLRPCRELSPSLRGGRPECYHSITVTPVSIKKLVPPRTKVICLGTLVDTVDFSVSIPNEKLQTIKHMCNNWVQKSFCTKRELQSLLGSLLYVAKCVKYARFFLNRMLPLLEGASELLRTFRMT